MHALRPRRGLSQPRWLKRRGCLVEIQDMSDSKGSLCITCGQPTGGAPRLNTLSSGQACPTCRDRLLESLPSLLPGETEVPEPSEVSEASMMLDEFEQEVEPPAPAESTPKGPSRLLRGETPNEPA